MANAPAAFKDAEQRYFAATPKSRALYERAKSVLPNGIGRAGIPFIHYPVFVEHAAGQYLYDADGRQILDLWNAASSLPLGHSHPAVVGALQEQLSRGIGMGVPGAPEIVLAELLRARVPSMEKMRFTASGTEATMFAVRLARAFSGRQLMGRMGNSYHGTQDMMMTGEGASLGGSWLGFNDNPVSAGVLPSNRDSVVFLPFDDLPGCEAIIERRAAELGTIIVEPFMGTGGALLASAEFLGGLRRLCDRHGIVLIFDEMISIGMGPGGAQGFFGIKPDLTTTGKLIGGGMPIGVFGGRADIMAMLEPVDGVPPVLHTGTWNGHQLAMAAGAAQLRALDDAAYRYLGHLGELFRTRIRALAAEMGVPAQVTGSHHFSAIHYAPTPVRVPADVRRADQALARRVGFSLLSQGFMMFGGRSNLSTAVTEADIDRFIEALAVAFEEAGAVARAPSETAPSPAG
jgi:glutamate-1-semialdehyde 2,1-aminomutase